FRKRVGPRLLYGVLGGDDQKWIRERMVLSSIGHGFFLHGFQQRRLGLWRRPVDFICQDQVGKEGAPVELEKFLAGFMVFLQNLSSQDISRHQIGGELYPLE